jgi:hypothetical protein
MKRADLRGTQAPKRPRRMKTRLKENLVRVDVAYPRDQILAQQEPLQRAAPVIDQRAQTVEGKRRGQRFHSERAQARKRLERPRGDQVHVAEPALIDKAQVAGAEPKDESRVRAEPFASRHYDEIPGHSQMAHDDEASAEVDEEILAAPADRPDPPAAQPPRK